MKFIISRNDLHAAMASVARIVEARNTIPILSNVWLGASGDSLKLRATDLDIEAEVRCEARVSSPGEITVSAVTFRDIAAKTSAGAEMTIEIDNGQLLIKSGRSKFKLAILPAEDFPDMAAIEPSHTFSIPAIDFDRLLNKSAFAMSTDETRYYLNGVYLHNEGGGLRFAATDGHRLAKISGSLGIGSAGMPGIIIPRKAVDEFKRLSAKATGSVDIALSQSKVSATFPNGVKVTSKLIDGTFPDYERIIPRNTEITCRVDRKELIEANDRVSALVGDKSAVKLEISDGKLQLSASNPDAGSSLDEIDAELVGSAVTVGMNARYLSDIIGAMSGDRVEFKITDPGSPVIIRDMGDDEAVWLIMPLRI